MDHLDRLALSEGRQVGDGTVTARGSQDHPAPITLTRSAANPWSNAFRMTSNATSETAARYLDVALGH
jgi:hypothetical protein